MTRTRWIGLAIAALVVEATLVRLGAIADPFPKLAGTAAWTTSRAAGVTAFGALTLDVVFGLFVSTGLVDRWVPRGASVDVHKWLSSVALALVGVHSVALLVDPAVHFDALDALVPGMSSYRAGAIAIGIVAMYGALVAGVDPRPKAYVFMTPTVTFWEWYLLGERPADKYAYIAQMRALDTVAYLPRATMRASLLQFGTRDTYVPAAAAQEFSAAVPERDKTVKQYAAGHDLAVDAARDDRRAWLATRLGLR